MANQFAGAVNGSYWMQTLPQKLCYPVTANESYFTIGCTNSVQSAFPNTMIPQSVVPAPTQLLMKYIPNPNDGLYFTTSTCDETLNHNKGSRRANTDTRLAGRMGCYLSLISFTSILVPEPAFQDSPH